MRRSRVVRRLLPLMLLLAVTLLAVPARAGDDFLDPELAFTLSARPVDDRSVELLFTAAPGYYLYREQFKFSAADAALDAPALPQGKVKFDETFQKSVETYRGEVRIVVPVRAAGARFLLLATNQGCADKGLCYPPTQRAVHVELRGFGGAGDARVLTASQTAALGLDATATSAGAAQAPVTGASPGTAASTWSPGALVTASSGNAVGLDAALRGGRYWTVVGVFFIAGLLLSLTPCVLPMLPILSSIIVGQGERAASRGRGLALALSYSLGMALVYTALGVAAGLAGEGLAAALQNPWVLGVFAAGLVALSLSMFGVYELQLPAALTGRLTAASQRLPTGRFVGVFAMGGVSALIVSPCVAAPLAGALVYLSQTRDVWLGGTALFCLAAGMSVPLVLVGASAGALLPRAGAWMNDVKRVFGVLLLGVALWTVQSLLPGSAVLGLWGVLAIAASVVLFGQPGGGRGRGRGGSGGGSGGGGGGGGGGGAGGGGAGGGGAGGGGAGGARQRPSRHLGRRAAAAVLATVGLLQLVGAASGGSNPLQPLAQLMGRPDAGAAAGGTASSAAGPAFMPVRSLAELDAALGSAGRPVLLDFYADWCVSCKEMERYTFTDAAVQARLRHAVLLRADVTANSPDDRALLRHFNLFGPPGTLIFDPQGQEIAAARVIGFQRSGPFLEILKSAGL